jgi:hypothetical protein
MFYFDKTKYLFKIIHHYYSRDFLLLRATANAFLRSQQFSSVSKEKNDNKI